MQVYRVKVNGKQYEVEVEEVDGKVSKSTSKEVKEEKVVKKVSDGANTINAPIAGKVIDIKVAVGDHVSKGQTVAIIEAMKLENEIQSPVSGVIKQINVNNGDDVRNKDVLFILE